MSDTVRIPREDAEFLSTNLTTLLFLAQSVEDGKAVEEFIPGGANRIHETITILELLTQ